MSEEHLQGNVQGEVVQPVVTAPTVVPTNVLRDLTKAEILIDIGNSESRAYLQLLGKRYYFVIPNRFAPMEAGSTIDLKYNNKKSMMFQHDGVTYLNGHIVDMESENRILRPVAYLQKVEQDVTYLTLQAIINRATYIIMQTGTVDLTKTQLSYSLNVLLPPLTAAEDEAELIKRLGKLQTVSMQVPMNVTLPVSLSLKVHSEAVSAFFSAMFIERGIKTISDNVTNPELKLEDGDYYTYDISSVQQDIRPVNSKFHNTDVLIIDIGAGTSDTAVARNMEIIEDSRNTFSLGGNLVESKLNNALKKSALKLSLSKKDLNYAIKTGLAREGVETYHVVDAELHMAKQRYADSFLEHLRSYFEGAQLAPRRLGGVLVVGGGGLPTKRITTQGDTEEKVVVPEMVHYIIEYLKGIAPVIQEVSTDGQDLRKMNLDGLPFLI